MKKLCKVLCWYKYPILKNDINTLTINNTNDNVMRINSLYRNKYLKLYFNIKDTQNKFKIQNND